MKNTKKRHIIQYAISNFSRKTVMMIAPHGCRITITAIQARSAALSYRTCGLNPEVETLKRNTNNIVS